VDGVDPGIRRGGVFGILGPNGARQERDGRDPARAPLPLRRRGEGLGEDPERDGRDGQSRIGVVRQDESAAEELTVAGTVRRFARYCPHPAEAIAWSAWKTHLLRAFGGPGATDRTTAVTSATRRGLLSGRFGETPGRRPCGAPSPPPPEPSLPAAVRPAEHHARPEKAPGAT
jgi:hypothetical protein